MIGQAVGAVTDATHGMTLSAVALPYYRLIMPYGLEKFARFATNVWGIDTVGKTNEELAAAGLNAMENWMREIGCETVGHVCLWCSNTFNEIMPYYNKMYETELLNVEHLLGIKRHKVVDMLRDFDESSSGNGSADTSTSSTGKSTNKFSDTPQDELFVSKVDAGDYLTNLTIEDTKDDTTVGTKSKSDGTIKRDETNKDTTDEFVTDPRYYQAFLDLSEKILNLDMQVIENVQVQGLFMQVWS